MTYQFTRITATIFGLGAVLHLMRAIVWPDLAAYLPIWLSLLLAIVMLALAGLHLAYKPKISCTCWSDTIGYSLTIPILLIGGLIHAYRVLVDSTVLLQLPIWISWIAIPIAGFCAWYNWHKRVK